MDLILSSLAPSLTQEERCLSSQTRAHAWISSSLKHGIQRSLSALLLGVARSNSCFLVKRVAESRREPWCATPTSSQTICQG